MFDEGLVRQTMVMLHQDALRRGMLRLCMVYGWSAIRLGNIMLMNGKWGR